MIREDIENLDFNSLSDLERREYNIILMANLRKICLQLINSNDTQLAAILQIAVNLAIISPPRLYDLLQYAAKAYEVATTEVEIARRLQMSQQSTEQSTDQPKDDFPPLD